MSSPPPVGVKLQEIVDALRSGYDYDTLDQMMMYRMSVELDGIASDSDGFNKVLKKVVTWAKKGGRLAELIEAAHKFNPGNEVIQEVHAKYGLAPAVVVQRGGTPVAAGYASLGGPERTIRDWLPSLDAGPWAGGLAAALGRVCRVRVNGIPAGTGFLVGPDAVLTNYHVLKDVLAQPPAAAPPAVTCQFDYKRLADGTELPGLTVGLAADWRVAASKGESDADYQDGAVPPADELDYALVRLARPVGNEPVPGSGANEGAKRGWVRVPDAAPVFTDPMALMILQHPRGTPLQIAFDTAAVGQGRGVNANRTRVRYAVTTDKGASGSPVFDINWNLVALHHFGDPAYHGERPKFNQGVPIDAVRANLGPAAAALGGDPPAA